jgi:hypothetical protein
MTLEFENFELQIEPNPNGGFRARVLHSPAGDGFETHDFDITDLQQDLKAVLGELHQNARGARGGTTRQLANVTNPAVNGAVQQFGANLFQTVFAGSIGEAWRRSLDHLGTGKNAKGLRIQLRLSEANELIDVPWEYLRDPGPPTQFVLNSNAKSLVRYLELTKPVQVLTVEPPLKILVMISNPTNVDALDVEAEWAHLKQALSDLESSRQVVLTRLKKATLSELLDHLQDPNSSDYHVFHFIGHGAFDQATQAGVLLLEGQDGQAREVSAEKLAAHLQNLPSLRLAILNACDGARTSSRDPFAGVAQTLAGLSVPAVVAMQFAISDEVAIVFARTFYRALSFGYPVDTALSQARLAIFGLAGVELEFGIPVLYMRSSDGKIFDVSGQAVSPAQGLVTTGLSNLEDPDDLVDPKSGFYIERDSDQQMLLAIRKNGVTITIKGPSGLGASLLLRRGQIEATKLGKTVAFLDFELFANEDLKNADQFFRHFCVMISVELDLKDKTAEYWAQNLPNSLRCKRYLGDYVLKEISMPLVLAMDSVERVFEANFRADFFGMLRSWHNGRGQDPDWKRLDMILTTSTEPSRFIDNQYQSPFNVGLTIEVKDFILPEVSELNRRYGSPLTEPQLESLMGLIGGHGYMVAKALYLIASQQYTLEGFLACAATDTGPFKTTLRSRLEKLLRSSQAAELKACLRQVLEHQRCSDEMLFSHLEGAGLVVSKPWPTVMFRYPIYKLYFQDHL